MKTFHILSRQALKTLKAPELGRYLAWLTMQKEKNLQNIKSCKKEIAALDENVVNKRESKKRQQEVQQMAAIKKALTNN